MARSIRLGKALKTRLMSGQAQFGAWVGIPHASVVEMLAQTDYDFLLIDAEHSAVEVKHLSTLLPPAELNDKPVIFRPVFQDAADIKTALDAGVAGVMLPMVETPEQARAIVGQCKYPPMGVRGIGPWRAAHYYERYDAYLSEANDATIVIVQIENAAGLDNVDEIAAVDGVDILFAGPADLARSLGLPVGVAGPELLAAFGRIAEAAKRHGKIAAIDLGAPEMLGELRSLGFSVFTAGSDMGFIVQSAKTTIAGLRASTEG